jgi:hypothetical protein
VLLTYVDESYTDNWFTMAALLVDGPSAVALTAELDRVAAAASKAYGLAPNVELHGHEIFHAGGAWRGVPVRARVGVFDDVVEAVAAQDVRVIARAMDVVGQRDRYRCPDLLGVRTSLRCTKGPLSAGPEAVREIRRPAAPES